MNELETVYRYHEETKHQFNRYARALGYMDWANQPDPFRRYGGSSLLQIPVLAPTEVPLSPPYHDIYRAGAIPPEAITARSLSRLFEYALAISAWKEFQGSRWALRSNPSSGNLHPTESYVLLYALQGLASVPSLYHYASKEHALELRMECMPSAFDDLMRPFPHGAFLIGLSTIHWREAWKYGERAFRYCQHDAGHAVGALRIAAATLGWNAIVLDGVDDPTIAGLLGLDRTEDFAGAEREQPECLIAVWPHGEVKGVIPLFVERAGVEELVKAGTWYGKANRLSKEEPVQWEIIDEVAAASWKSCAEPMVAEWSPTHALSPEGRGTPSVAPLPTAGQIIRQRRSAVALDGKTGINAATFFHMCSRVIASHDRGQGHSSMPWDVWPWEPRIHLGIFVHLVEGISPGLYVLVRDPSRQVMLRQHMHEHFHWRQPEGCPPDLPLYLLQEGDARQLAAQVSCHQAIAGDGAFSLGMFADFTGALETHGAWFYRRLYWESGIIGQVLYLEAEAAGIRATGIGCFFDDPVHRVFGLKDKTFQSLYHFTAGGPVDDPRLTTLPAYEIQP